ncbi:lipid A biosynthesis lauroyl acyltransferase [Helicobacter sp. MIT 14-3879]|uniref:lipid A biosynthesis lauroyl acyltransferase n=1 Tax=Helicobacter sp. MIT 14-3879 TaxID=2040649 RepID=UPI000E1F80A0|nr:lipid A biosynthesis lauroyl acyltransferase [Helicobacter sp. MIT 14-3879]RDU62630.1 hypothetical protein CQA44_06495 [Helicobacter sp. MIT 14-3879]
MKKILNKILDIFIVIFANISGFILSLMNDKIFFYNVKLLGFIFKALDKRRGKDCLNNLNFAYNGTLDYLTKNKILNKCYDNFAFVILNAIRLLYMNKGKYIKKFKVYNEYLIEELIKNGNFIFITAHYGDWEGTARYVAYKHKEIKLSVVGRLTQFSSINSLMEKSRQKFGSFFLDKKGVSRNLIKLLSDKKNIIGLVIDQNISDNEGIWVKMFDKDVTHTPIASILARKYNIPIVFAYMKLSNDYSKYYLHFEKICDAIITQDYKDDIKTMTQLQADFTEKIIREKNEEWFWFHKRFKAKYNEIYKYF